MARSRLKESTTKSIVDKETGELSLVESEKVYTINTPTEEFFQVYCRLIGCIYKLKSINDIKLLIKFCEIAEFNTGKVLIPTPERKTLCNDLGIQNSNFSKSIKNLKDKCLLSGERGSYLINPAVFWKGEQKVRSQILKEGGLSMLLNFREE